MRQIITTLHILQILKEYENYEFYANKFYNLDETNKFFERHKLLQLAQDKIDGLSSFKTIAEIMFTVKTLPQRQL